SHRTGPAPSNASPGAPAAPATLATIPSRHTPSPLVSRPSTIMEGFASLPGAAMPHAVDRVLAENRACRICEAHLPLGPRPVVQASATSRVLIVSQAPGRKVHETGIPFNDPSGRRLRRWMGVDDATFYDPGKVAIVPMGFCFPGTGKGGDLPPRPECAPTWHPRLLP